MRTRGLAFGVLAFSAAHATAVEIDSLPSGPASITTGQVPTIVVTASRLDQPLLDYAGNAFVWTHADMGRWPAVETGSLLQPVPGLHLYDATGNQSRWVVASRGFVGAGEAEYVELLLDGIPTNELQKGLADFNLLSPSQLGRFEVLRGPVSALYGDLATAGVVQLVSQPASRPGSQPAPDPGTSMRSRPERVPKDLVPTVGSPSIGCSRRVGARTRRVGSSAVSDAPVRSSGRLRS
jgi:outer membrane cobalamin receptor